MPETDFPQKRRSKFPHVTVRSAYQAVAGAESLGLGGLPRRRGAGSGGVMRAALERMCSGTSWACCKRGRVAGTFDLDDHSVVQEPVEERGGDDRVGKISPHSAKPRLEVRIIAPPLVAGVDEPLEGQAAAIRGRPAGSRSHRRSGGRRGRRSGSCRAAGPRARPGRVRRRGRRG